MNKIPVLATVSRTYGFLLGEFGTIFRLAWAPMLMGAGLSFALGGQAIDAMIQSKGDPAVQMQYAPMQFLIGLVTFAGSVMATVALLQVVIFGDRKPGLFVYLWLGAAELRLIAVTVLLIVALAAGGIALLLIAALLGALAAAIPALGVIVGIGVFALVPLAIWAALRLSLIGPVVVAENTLGVERSWALMKGNAWRMFLVLLLTVLPLAAVSVLVVFSILGADLPPFPSFPKVAGNNPEETRAAAESFAKAMEAWELGFTGAVRKHWVAMAAFGFVTNLIQIALLAGAQGNAYNALAGERHA